VYWHAFLSPRTGLHGALERLYQWLALKLMRHCRVVSTSPVLLEALVSARVPVDKLSLLPCCLLPEQEVGLDRIATQRSPSSRTGSPRKVIAIGRLDSYKRIDWLIEAIALVPSVQELHVVGDGPKRDQFEALAARRLLLTQHAYFHGRVSEAKKLELLAQADLLVLASSQCNEAFGIVQLEAMASGLPAIALQLPRSGMFWVSNVQVIPGWNGLRHELPDMMNQLFSDPDLYSRACIEARARYQCVFARALWERRVDSLIAGDG
jgi:glycosyltransferase involved in cell wall biosynthesis